jgi:hypothetical protein
MKLSELNDVTRSLIVGGSEYLWKCWPNGRHIDYEYTTTEDGRSTTYYCHAVYSSETNVVYEVSLSNDLGDIRYLWLNPDFREAHTVEAKTRGIDYRIAWDNVYWDEVSKIEILELVRKYYTPDQANSFTPGKKYSRIIVDLDDDTYRGLQETMIKRNITFNQLVEEILIEEFNRIEMENKR